MELIVVVAIAAVLLSLLQPSLAKTISIAKDKECKNNLGQVSRAMQLFVDDNGSMLPGPFWSGHRPRYGRNGNIWDYYLPGYLSPYLLAEVDEEGYMYIDTFQCPSIEESSESPLKRIERISYFTPLWYSELQMRPFGRPQWSTYEELPSMSFHDIPDPQKHFVMEDADLQNMPWISVGYLPQYPIHFQAYRNRNYFDGHVGKEDWYP